jgi:hypothetical protein
MLFVTAWNSMSIALLQRAGSEWRELDELADPVLVDGVEKSRDTRSLVGDAFAGDTNYGLRENIGFWIDLRNAVAHRCLPALDPMVIPHAQAGLLNFEAKLVEQFGDEFALAEALSVPLQLSGFRDPGVLGSRKRLLGALPLDVQAILSRADATDPDLLSDPTFMLRGAFVPIVPSSGRNPDAVAHFARPDDVPDDLAELVEQYVVLAKPRRSAAQFRASDVVAEVSLRTGFKFHWLQHSEAARRLGVWPTDGTARTLNERYAEYNSAFKGWLYTRAWIELLVEKCASPEGFREVTGRDPVPVDSKSSDSS